MAFKMFQESWLLRIKWISSIYMYMYSKSFLHKKQATLAIYYSIVVWSVGEYHALVKMFIVLLVHLFICFVLFCFWRILCAVHFISLTRSLSDKHDFIRVWLVCSMWCIWQKHSWWGCIFGQFNDAHQNKFHCRHCNKWF